MELKLIHFNTCCNIQIFDIHDVKSSYIYVQNSCLKFILLNFPSTSVLVAEIFISQFNEVERFLLLNCCRKNTHGIDFDCCYQCIQTELFALASGMFIGKLTTYMLYKVQIRFVFNFMNSIIPLVRNYYITIKFNHFLKVISADRFAKSKSTQPSTCKKFPIKIKISTLLIGS